MPTVWQQAKPWAVPPLPRHHGRKGVCAGRRRRKSPLGPVIFLVCLFTLGLALYAQREVVWAVEVDGRRVAAVRDVRAVEAALAEIERSWAGESSAWRDRVRVVRAWGREEGADAALPDRLARCLGLLVRGTALEVNGEVKMVFKDRAVAQMFLNYLTRSYRSTGSPRFLEQVALVDVTVPRTRIVDIQTALAQVQGKIEATTTYTVRPGDTSWDIARAHGITPAELAAANPGVDLERLQPGQKINVSFQKPLLTLVTTERVTRLEAIPAPLKVKRDPGLYIGQRKVIQPGRPGQKEVTYLITRHNGTEVGREVVASRVIAEPVPRVEARGSRLMLASRSGGQLAWPARGYISSRFGGRGRGYHTGIDIAAGYGAPVGAAEGGRVVYAGWGGGYGRMVEISHGGGVTTVYAHLSSITVSVGQEVERGQVIGYVGASGNATGPHLHFEVRVNGSARNPLQYL